MNKKKKGEGHKYLKYSGIAIQLFVLLLVLVLGGQWLDDYMNTQRPYFTISFVLLGLVAFFYKLIVELGRDNEH